MEQRINGVACARLSRYGMLSLSGADVRAFLHAQLTNDIANLAPGRAAFAGWCSAKGRLLASFLVLPHGEGFLLQLARDLAAGVAKRLSMFILRAKVRLADASGDWAQLGVWGQGAAAGLAAAGVEPPGGELSTSARAGTLAVRLATERFLLLAPPREIDQVAQRLAARSAREEAWMLEEIRAGRPFIDGATQDRFVPQMVNFEAIGAIDFGKGCYPGQEIVARAQYRGQLKRRMVRARALLELHAGQDLFSDDHPGQASGTVVNVAPADGGSELLAVVPIESVRKRSAIRTAPGGPALEILPLPYSQ